MRQGHGQRDGQLVQDGAWHKMLGPAHARAAIEHRPSLNRLRDVMKVLRHTQHIISTDLQTERLSTALRLTARYRKRAGVPFIIWAFKMDSAASLRLHWHVTVQVFKPFSPLSWRQFCNLRTHILPSIFAAFEPIYPTSRSYLFLFTFLIVWRKGSPI